MKSARDDSKHRIARAAAALARGAPEDALIELSRLRDERSAVAAAIAGVAYVQLGRPWRALERLNYARDHGAPAGPVAVNRALAHLRLNDAAGAFAVLRNSQSYAAGVPEYAAILAGALIHLERFEEALAVTAGQDVPAEVMMDLTVNRITALLHLGQEQQALAECEAALQAQPGHSSLRANRALALAGLGHATESLREALALRSRDVLHATLDILIDDPEFSDRAGSPAPTPIQVAPPATSPVSEAIAALEPVAPSLRAAWIDRLLEAGLARDALRACQKLAVNAGNPTADLLMARAQAMAGDLPGAEATLRAGYASCGDLSGHFRGSLLGHDPRADARTLYVQDRATSLERLFWQDYQNRLDTVIRDIERSLDAGLAAPINPYLALLLPLCADLQRRIAVSHARVHAARAGARLAPPPHVTRPIHVGYLSADFRNHPTGHLVRRLFGLHDRTGFRVTAYALRPGDDSPYHWSIQRGVDAWVELQGLSDDAAAQRIAGDGVHILIDLMGYSKGSRPGILARRPAPLQISFLGMPATTGADYIDYLIADPIVLPKEHRGFYHEAPLLLPGCCQVCDSQSQVAPEVITRDDEGLPENGFVYCSFNRERKLTPALLDSWGRILAAVPDSFLWLLRPQDDARTQRLIDGLRQRGVEPRRLILAPSTLRTRHLRRLALADLFLDAFVYSAATTGADALLAGLPLLTLRGQTFQSRVASSLLLEAGLPELIADTQADYEALAIRLAGEPERLSHWREQLQASRKSGDLLSTERFVGHLERGLQMAWARAVDGLPPQALEVPR